MEIFLSDAVSSLSFSHHGGVNQLVQQVEVIDGRTDKPVLNRPEDESFFEATDADASKADEGKCLVFK